jgi:shikimate dehydrogenase
MRERPTRLVLLGHPVGHSLSPIFQNAALKSAGLAATYDALDVLPAAIPSVLRELARAGVAGNVTIPHKEVIAAACVVTTELAARVGAVNTFWHEKGKLIGDNTDVDGARVALSTVLSGHASPLRVAVLGAGGAAAAVLVALESFEPESVVVHTRTPARADALALRLNAAFRVATSAEEAVRDATLVINCTPVGLQGDAMPVAVDALRTEARVLDLIPLRGETPWVRAARAAGHEAEDGMRMLVEQGAAAFERWFDMVPDRAAMSRSLGMRLESAAVRTKTEHHSG